MPLNDLLNAAIAQLPDEELQQDLNNLRDAIERTSGPELEPAWNAMPAELQDALRPILLDIFGDNTDSYPWGGGGNDDQS